MIKNIYIEKIAAIPCEAKPGHQAPCRGIWAMYYLLETETGRSEGFAPLFYGLDDSSEKNRLAAKSEFSDFLRNLGVKESEIHTHLVEWWPKKN